MYVYLITLHRDEADTSLPSSGPIVNGAPTSLIGALYDRMFSTDHAPSTGTEIFGLRWIFHEDAVPAETVAAALTQYYKKFFEGYNVPYGTGTLPLSKCHIKCECISLPTAYTPEKFEEEHLGIHTGHGALMFRPDARARGSIVSPFQMVHAKLAKESGRQLFVAHVKAWAAAQEAAAAWVRARSAPEKIAFEYPLEGPIQGSDLRAAFDGKDHPSAIFPPVAPKRTFLDREAGRTLAVDLAVNRSKGKPMAWYLEPCALTPFLGSQFCPEASIIPIETPLPKPDPAFPAVSQERLHAAMKSIGTLMDALPGANQVEAQAVVAEINSVLRGCGTTTPSASKAPHAKHLEELWKIFTEEYVSKQKVTSSAIKDIAMPVVPRNRDELIARAGCEWEQAIPTKLFLIAWKLFAMRPKQSPLHKVEHFEDTIVGVKELPVTWEKDITPDVLTEWFYSVKGQIIRTVEIREGYMRTDVTKNAFLSPLLNESLNQVINQLYGVTLPRNHAETNPLDYAKLDELDYTPVLEYFQGGTQSEASKKAWVAAFVRERLKTPAEGSSLGSAELYSTFKEWLERIHASKIDGYAPMVSVPDKFLTQFPITEFTRLMKAAGFEMTRRARGMVYLNVAMASGDVWSKEEPEGAAEAALEEEKQTRSAEAAEVNTVPNPIQAAEENMLTDVFGPIRLQHGCNPAATLEAYIKQRDAVYKEQMNRILTNTATVDDITKVLDGLPAEPEFGSLLA